MVDTQYEAILRDFGEYFKCKLAPDKLNMCKVRMPDSVDIFLQVDPRVNKLMIVSRIGLLQGGFRNTVLREALKANEYYDISTGAFGLGKKTNHLMLFLLIDIDTLNPDKINAVMPKFISRAKLWAEGLKSGNLPPLEDFETRVDAPSPFGLK